MFCPQCKGEFIPGVTRCNTCDVLLVDSLDGLGPEPGATRTGPDATPAPATAPAADAPEPTPALTEADARPVTVLSTGDPGLMALAKSLLEAEGIPSMTSGEAAQDLFGLGRLGGFNVIVGPVELRVRAVDAETARALLEGIEDGEFVAFDDDWDDEGDPDDEGESDAEGDPDAEGGAEADGPGDGSG